MSNFVYTARDSGTAFIIALILGLILTVLLFVFVIPERKREVLNRFFQKVHDFFTIKGFWLESIAKFIFVLLSVFFVIFGFATFFVRDFGFFASLAIMVFGPIFARLIYEGIMMMLLLVRNTIDIRNHLKGVVPDAEKTAEPPKPEEVINKVVSGIKRVTEAAPEEDASDEKEGSDTSPAKVYCKNCGKPNEADSSFCEFCGKPLD